MRQEQQNTQKQNSELLANRYQLVRKLASGSMGTVYLATDKKLGNIEVALKILHPKYLSDDIVFKRFANEVILARRLSHDNIVKIFDFENAQSGERIISMEYVAGTTLDNLIFELHGDVDPEDKPRCNLYEADFKRLFQIYKKILQGIAHAHSQGILHRDIKPSNVLIAEGDLPKVADFGLAAVSGASAGLTSDCHALLGTPDYMAPEHVAGERMTARSDIYSLGMLAFEMITGRPAFIAESPLAVAYMQVKTEFPSLSEMPAFIPQSFLNLIARATLKDPTKRFASVEEMISHLEQKNTPIELKSTLYKTQTIRKNPTASHYTFGTRPKTFRQEHPWLYFLITTSLAAIIGAASFLSTNHMQDFYSAKVDRLEQLEKPDIKPAPVVEKSSTKKKKSASTSSKSKTKL